jgi:hypothetical protein
VSRAILLPLALLLTGCPRSELPKRVELYATTAAPPGKSALITNTDTAHRIAVARGVAIAVQTWTTCPNAPVSAVTSGDPNVLGARTVYRNGQPNQFVLWGQTVGTTTLRLANGCAEQQYEVTVTHQ